MKSDYLNYEVSHLTGKNNQIGLHNKLDLLPAVKNSFNKMQEEAKKDGITLILCSGYRSFERQTSLWNNRYRKLSNSLPKESIVKKILEYLALPGTSRHHWGTDIDIIGHSDLSADDPLSPENYLTDGCYENMYLWLSKNASRFDFYETYTNDKLRQGFLFEPWHYSYKPISIIFIDCFLNDNWSKNIDWRQVLGSDILDKAFFKNYTTTFIQGINPLLLEKK